MMDNIGNEVHVGDLVHYAGDFAKIGEVIEIHDGGVNMRNTEITPQTVTIIFKVTVAAPPRTAMKSILVLKKPQEEGSTKIASA